MVKLTNNEIQDKINFETGGDSHDNEIYIPRKARSKFRFWIEQDSAALLKDLEEGPKRHSPQVREDEIIGITGEVRFYGGEPDWKLCKTEDGYLLKDPLNERGGMNARVWQEDNKLMIKTTASGFLYEITPNKEHSGSVVEFSGPVHGLLSQRLLPQMTYVPYTLEGKFVDNETGKDLTDYMDMHSYGQLRAKKNKQPDEFGETGNQNDKYKDVCAKINEKFNNEIPFFEKNSTKYEQAQQDFVSGKKVTIHGWKKDKIREHIAKVKERISGTVVADRIAEEKISGKEKRKITPEVGAMLAKQIRDRQQ